MAIRNYNDNAWENIADLLCPEVNGARESAHCARAWVNDAWEDVWNDEEFVVQVKTNCHIADKTVTMAFSWDANSGDGGDFYIVGDFEAGESYEISMTCKTGATALGVYGYPTNTTGVENYNSFTFSAAGQTKTITITPKADIGEVRISFSAGGTSGGSYIGSFTNIMVNGIECTYEE